MCPAENNGNNKKGWIIPIGGAEEKARNPVVLQRFCALAGGEEARIQVIPTASEMDDTGPVYVRLFEEMGAKARFTRSMNGKTAFGRKLSRR